MPLGSMHSIRLGPFSPGLHESQRRLLLLPVLVLTGCQGHQ